MMKLFHTLFKKGMSYFFFCLFLQASADDFGYQWAKMGELFRELICHSKAQFLDNFVHPHWNVMRKEMHPLLLGKPNPHFLHHHIIVGAMLRTGYGQPQKYETDFLLHCLSPSVQEKLARFKETSIGGGGRECKQLDCSANTLGQLYYFMKVLELRKPNSLSTVIEIGGGYGCLARVAKLTIPELTYILIDLPELCALQYLFLSLAVPYVEIKVHREQPTQFEKGVIHIVPIYFLPELEIHDADALISAFGLSETPEYVQQIVLNKNFFNASSCYIVGQANTTQSWVAPQSIINHVRKQYPRNYCHQFHIDAGEAFLYEVFGFSN